MTLFSRLRAGKLCEAGLPKVLSPSVRGSLDSLNAGYEPYPAFAIFMEIFCEISVEKCIMLTKIAVYSVKEQNWRFFRYPEITRRSPVEKRLHLVYNSVETVKNRCMDRLQKKLW